MEKNISNEHMSNTSQKNTPASSSVASIPTPVNTKVYPKPKFLKLLQSVGAEGTSFEIPKIINYLKKYIFSKKLFNQEKPWLVHCDDQLRKVFRCKQFTIREVRGLLNQNVTLFESVNVDVDDEDESFDSDATEIVSSSDHEPPKKATPLDDIISSSTSEQPKPVVNSTGPLFRLKPSFLQILHDAGAKGELFSEKEIFRHLKNYVWSRRLFHPLHQWICLCQNDKLANVFKCDKFVIPDVPYLVAKFGVDYPTYHPKVRRGSSDLIPKTVNNVTVPLRSYNSAPGCTRSTPSDITSSTADAISPMFTEKFEHLSWRSKDNGLAFSKESSCTMLGKSVENSSTVADKSEENTSVTPERVKDGDYLALGNSKENCSTAANKCDENSSPEATNRYEENQSSQHNFSRELTASSTSSQRNNSFTLTLKMQDDNEVLNFQGEKPVTDDEDDDDDVYVEYEVMSNSSSFHMSESEDEHHEVSMGMLVICQDSDRECYADYSEDGSDTDVELSDADKWCCSTCHLYNSPIHRFCDRCWTQRPGWLPDRDKPSSSNRQDDSVVKRKQGSHHIKNLTKNSLDKLRTKDNSANLSSEDDISSDDASQHSDNFVRSSSRPPTPSDTSVDLQNLVNKECNETLDLRTTLSNICHFAESEVPTQQNQSRNLKRNLISDSNESDFVSKFPKMSSPVKNFVAPGNCIICLQNPKDASLIHGASGHQICCLYCAKKLKEQGRKCPICRQSIQKVVRNYLA